MKKTAITIVLFITAISACKKNNTNNNSGNPMPISDSIITTVAGTGTYGFSGDGGLAVIAQFGLSSPRHIIVDKNGNIYVSDNYNQRIRKINSAGIISTIAGNGSNGFSGDGGLATSAEISTPQGLAIDTDGNIYFADEGNGRIRKISSAGIITTVAGGGTYSDSNAGIGGPATSAKLNQPQDVLVDGVGNIIICDWGNHRLKKVDKTTGIITVIAGNGMQSFAGDNGPATAAALRYPQGIALDTQGNLFVVSDNRIRKINTSGIISTIAGTGSGSFNKYNGAGNTVNVWPVGITFNNIGELIIADYGQSLVRKMDATGNITTIAGYGGFNTLIDGGKPYLAGFTYPTGVASDTKGNLYIADYGAKRVRKITIK